MTVYRCTLKKWAKDLSGTGAFLYGGRWNNTGIHLVYTAENNVLAALEVALRIPLELIHRDYIMVPIHISGTPGIIEPDLPAKWRQNMSATKSIGDQFVREQKALMLKVPSALISDAYNYVINPRHPDAKRLRTGEPRPIIFDERLVQRMRGSHK